MPLPVATFDPADSIFSGLSIIQFTPEGGTATAEVFEAAQIDDDPEQEVKYLDRPNKKGQMRHARSVETKANEKWTFGLDEVKRLTTLFGGKLRGRIKGTCTLWIPDTDDETGKIALKSQDAFKCVLSRDGKVQFGGGEFSKATIKIESEEADDITWTKDAVTT